jgi:hypothetical protein
MSDAQGLIARVLAAREVLHEVEPAADGKPAKWVKVRRPPRAELPRLKHLDHAFVIGCVVDWGGFTEADLLPPGLGGNSPVPFNRELFGVVAVDKPWFDGIAVKLVEITGQFLAAEKDAAKN